MKQRFYTMVRERGFTEHHFLHAKSGAGFFRKVKAEGRLDAPAASIRSLQELYTLSVFWFAGSQNPRQGLAKAPRAFSRNGRAGFTLVETLVAITVLLLAIVGPMTIASRGLQSAFFAKEQLTAVYLAQEGVEIVRSIRDQNALDGAPWLTGLDTCINDICGVDVRNLATPIDCNPASACILNYDDGTLGNDRGAYTHENVGSPSAYTRHVRVNSVSAVEAEIVVEVTWETGIFVAGGTKTVTLQSRIFDQYATTP
jgi:prepilin-type N-terminal cleavage/methylation domain-containing protein